MIPGAGGGAGDNRSRSFRLAVFGIMTFMLIAIISVIVITLFAVVFLSRNSQEAVLRHSQQNYRPPPQRLPIVVAPRRQILLRHRQSPVEAQHQRQAAKVRKQQRRPSRLRRKLAKKFVFRKHLSFNPLRKKAARRHHVVTKAADD